MGSREMLSFTGAVVPVLSLDRRAARPQARQVTVAARDPAALAPRERASRAASHGDERELVARLRARDRVAFAELLDAYHGRLLRVAGSFVSSRAVAEEVVQETWLAVLDGLHRFEGRSSLQTWIFGILANRAKTRGVREQRVVPFSALSSDEERAEPAVDPSRFRGNGMWAAPPQRWQDGAAESVLMAQQGLERVQKALEQLPPGQRAVVTLRDIEGLDADEVCNVLEISETNQRVLLHRARSKLRAVLEECIDRN